MSGSGIGTPAVGGLFVSLDDFEVRYENTVPVADQARVTALLDDACALVTDITGTTDAPYNSTTVPGAIVATVCNAVRRAYENPLGLGGETIGDYSWRVAAGSDSGVYFTPNEARIMRRSAGKSRVGSITLTTYLPAPASDPLTSSIWTAVDEDSL